MTYRIDYTGDNSENGNAVIEGGNAVPEIRYVEMPRRGFAIPAILKTSTAFVLGAAALFSAEMWGPDWLRPSTPMGHYEAQIEADVKEAELNVQAQYEPYVAQVKATAEKEVEQYKARNQLLLSYYQAGLDRAKFYAEQTAKFQAQVAGAQMDRTRAEQSGVIGLVSFGRVIGELANAYQDGAGDGALEWSQERSNGMADELQRAAQNGVQVRIDGWDADLPDPAIIQMQLTTLPSMQMPAPPVIRYRSDTKSK